MEENKLIKKSENLFGKLEKIGKFNDRYDVWPVKEMVKIAKGLESLAITIPDTKKPQNKDELIQAELKRRVIGAYSSLTQMLSGKLYDFDTIISMYAIPRSDIENLKPWLETNRKRTLESIDRLFKTKNIQSYELDLSGDIPSVRRQAEEFTAVHIQKYHKRLGKLLQNLTKVGEYLRDINAAPTTLNESYFNPHTNTLAISIPAICYMTEDSSLYISEEALIGLYGHEGMGHALNQIITHSKELPHFLKRSYNATMPTAESVAQFYEKQIFEDLKASPETKKALRINHKFDEIYQEAKDTAQLEEYNKKLYQYAITVLADKSLGDSKSQETLAKKRDLIMELALDPSGVAGFIENHKDRFDSQGNLYPNLVSKLIYCAQPVQRALKEFAKQGIAYEGEGRSKIDSTLLKGFWTPIGYVDNARLAAKE